jgi:hypothetical protein
MSGGNSLLCLRGMLQVLSRRCDAMKLIIRPRLLLRGAQLRQRAEVPCDKKYPIALVGYVDTA